MRIPRALLTINKNEIRIDMEYNPRSLEWEAVLSYGFQNRNELEKIEFKNIKLEAKVKSAQEGENLAETMDKQLKL